MASADRLVWIDCEMTGLDPKFDEIVEIACIVTDAELNELDEGITLVVKPGEESFAGMDDFVVNMHTVSGLIEEIPLGIALADVELAQAEQQILEYIKKFVPNAKEAPLAGNTIGTDRMFLNKYMPELDQHLHYRNIDVSSIKELTRRWYPRVYFASPEKKGNHRALGDIRDSISELRYYREAVFVPQPGPDSEAARALGAEHTS